MADCRFKKYFSAFAWPWYTPKASEYEGLLKEFGFAEANVWGENADRYFVNVEEMVKWIDQPSIVPLLKQVAEKDKKGFRDAVVERMIAATKQGDGTCFETFRRIHVSARK